jgi:tetratricopeptide (TPR) repeat protein
MLSGVLLVILPSSYNPVYIKEIMVSFSAALFLASFFTAKERTINLQSLIPFAILAWALISLLSGRYILAGIPVIMKMSVLFIIYFVIANWGEALMFPVRRAILLTSVPVILIGYIQLLFPKMFVILLAFNGRVPGTFGNPNFLGAYLAALLPFIFFADFGRSKINAWLKAAAAACIMFLAYKTGSKAALLGMAAETLLYALLLWKSGASLLHRVRENPLIFAAGAAAFCGAVFLLIQNFYSVSFRLQVWAGTIKLVLANLLTGSGPGSFSIVFPAFRPQTIMQASYMHSYEITYPENFVLQAAAEYGLVGLLILIFFIWTILKKIDRSKADYYTAFCGLLAVNMAGVDINFAPSAMLLAVLAGVLTQGGSRELVIGKKTGTVVMICLTAMMLCIPYFQIKNLISDKYLSSAVLFSESKQWQNAVENYRKAINYNRANLPAGYFLSAAYYDSNPQTNASAALSQLEEVEKQAPDYVLLHYKKAVMLKTIGREDDAIKEYEKMIKLDPYFLPAISESAYIYYKNGYLNDAAEKFEIAVKNGSADASIYNNLGNIYFMQKRVNDAVYAYKKAIEIKADKDYYYNLGCIYFTMNDIAQARENINKASEIASNEGIKEAKIDNMIRMIKQYERTVNGH